MDRVSLDGVFCGFCDEKWRVRFLLIFGKVFFKRLWKRIFELFLKIFEKDPKFEEILNKFLDNFLKCFRKIFEETLSNFVRVLKKFLFHLDFVEEYFFIKFQYVHFYLQLTCNLSQVQIKTLQQDLSIRNYNVGMFKIFLPFMDH